SRIVNVEKFFAVYPFQASELDLKIQVEDSFYLVNEGIYRLKINKNDVDVKRENISNPDVKCTIQQLSAIMLGYQCPIKLLENEMIVGKEEKLRQLKQALQVKQTFLADFF